jgi:hypothetical protein
VGPCKGFNAEKANQGSLVCPQARGEKTTGVDKMDSSRSTSYYGYDTVAL